MDHLTSLYLIFGIIVFVLLPACILGDNSMWPRKK